ncbi:MAG: DsbA family protein [Candidatus Sungbacteria bacterium]|nr:DsbA family protein [Candidatus Sungbacteria bacterium]
MEESNNEGNAQAVNSNNTPSPFLIPGAIVVSGVLIAGAIIYTNSFGAPAGGNNLAGAGTAPIIKEDLSDNDPMLGSPEAPVTVVEFADFQCPFCGKFFKTVMPQLTEKYIKTGKVKFVYRDFAFLGEESEFSASAAECAKEQGKYWEYHDYLFGHQNGENQGAFDKKNLKQFARALGLNGGQFDTCLNSDKYLEEVRSDTEAGRAVGVSGTPTTFVNGKAIVGAVPFAQFEAAIAEALKKAK